MHGSPSLEAHLLGLVEYEQALALARRLVFDASGSNDRQIRLLVCEHPPVVTIGRQGSRAHFRADEREFESRQIPVRWVNRGGGCLVHAPGQLAVYPIVPLDAFGWTVGQYLARFQQAWQAVLGEMGIPAQTRVGRHGLWGRTGQLVTFGVAVNGWTTYHGAFLNVDPSMTLQHLVDNDPVDHTPFTSLVVERQQPIKMQLVRARLIGHLATAFEVERQHLYSGHPYLAPKSAGSIEPARRRVG
ncbi:MAG: lipoyl(octanoyl) transferase LipB [Pirellulales bacterium]